MVHTLVLPVLAVNVRLHADTTSTDIVKPPCLYMHLQTGWNNTTMTDDLNQKQQAAANDYRVTADRVQYCAHTYY